MRARNYQRRSERIVSKRDLEDAIYEEVLMRSGIVKAFPFVEEGDWDGDAKPGHTTVIVMTATGLPVGDEKEAAIRELWAREGLVGQTLHLSGP